MIQVNARRRGIPIKPIAFHTPVWSDDLVHLISHLSFDGRVDRYGCYYYNRIYSQAHHVKCLLHELLGLHPKLKRRKNGIWVVSCYGIKVASWLLQKKTELLDVIRKSESWRLRWLQALFDDEGHVHVRNGVRRVRASQKDQRILRIAQGYLKELGIESRIDCAAQAVELTGRNNLASFLRYVNFSPGIRINARRLCSFTIWAASSSGRATALKRVAIG
ncbi:MAG: LAGLIDADG family homing endonuclease [Candidatus Omnitrophica bacterium]|nr:LAGLIDADG family homing endonuclease [Candidatus Omnitrophota bacterium]